MLAQLHKNRVWLAVLSGLAGLNCASQVAAAIPQGPVRNFFESTSTPPSVLFEPGDPLGLQQSDPLESPSSEPELAPTFAPGIAPGSAPGFAPGSGSESQPGNSGIDQLFPPLAARERLAPHPVGAVPATGHAATHPSPGGTYGGLEWGFWGWISYLRIPQADFNSFWAYEMELDLTRSFSERIAANAKIDFMDLPGNEVYLEQLFVSVLLDEHCESILTLGKFNTPFGLENRDFWFRRAASRSLLFRAQPQDVTGIMLTQPLANTNWIVRPMVISGLTPSGFDNNESFSYALMIEYHPCDEFRLAATNWWGPELDNNNTDDLYFLQLQAELQVNACWEVGAELLYGSTASPAGTQSWLGCQVLSNYDLNDRLRWFAVWSTLDDRQGFQTGVAEHRHRVNTGFGWYWHPQVELRSEYRHDFRAVTGDRDVWAAHLTFGY